MDTTATKEMTLADYITYMQRTNIENSDVWQLHEYEEKWPKDKDELMCLGNILTDEGEIEIIKVKRR